MSCKTCKWFDVKPNKAGRIVIRKDTASRCIFPLPELPELPHSVTKSYGWPESGIAAFRRAWMPATSGVGCPAHEERLK